MHFDALTLAAVVDELQDTVVGGRVQQIVMTDPYSIGMEIYAQRVRRYLLLCATPNQARIHLVSGKLRRGVDRQAPLFLLARKYLRGALLVATVQPDSTDRVLRLVFDHPEQGETTLVAEPIGRMPNLILLGPGDRILDCVRRVRPGERRQRAVMPNRDYTPPPAQNKLPPHDDGSYDYYGRLQAALQGGGPLWRTLVTTIAGLSPSAAREAAWRATGSSQTRADQADLLPVAHAVQELWGPVDNGQWTPGLWLNRTGAGEEIVGFSPYYAHLADGFQTVESVSIAIEQFYAQLESRQNESGAATGRAEEIERSGGAAAAAFPLGADAYAVQRQAAAQSLRGATRKLERRLDALMGDLPEPGEIDRLRTEAGWLLALNSQIQEGSDSLEVDLGEEFLRIPLEANRSPIEQAERMFKRAAKLERATKIIPQRRKVLETDLAYLDQLQVDLQLAENQPEIAAVRDELQNMGLTGKRRIPKTKTPNTGEPMRLKSPTGFEIVVGRNARQNEVVTFRVASADDLWLHARDVPGSHVVVRLGGRQPDEATVVAAAQLAAYHSKARGERSASVIVAERRFVSRIAGGRTGQVSVRNDRTVTVPAELPDLS